MQNIIIFDLDNTLLKLSDAPHKDHIVTPNESMIQILKLLWRSSNKAPLIFIITGRNEELRKMTQQEMLTHNVFCDELIMNDMRVDFNMVPGHVFKENAIRWLKRKYNIVAAFDDDEASCEVYQREWIQVLKVL